MSSYRLGKTKEHMVMFVVNSPDIQIKWSGYGSVNSTSVGLGI